MQQSGLTQLTGLNSYGGGTTVNGGELRVGNGGSTGNLGSGEVYLGYNSLLSFNRNNTYTVPQQIDGGGSVAQMGPGLLALTGPNTYSGGATVSGGKLAAESPSAVPGGSLLSIGSAGSLVLGVPGALEPLAAQAGGGAPLAPQAAPSSAGQAASAVPTAGGGVNAVPEPGTMALLAAGVLCGFGAWLKRKKRTTDN